jgi:CopG family nickel-responsive transcriptional regulator
MAEQRGYDVNPMTKIVRVGVAFPPDMLKEFDEITHKMTYESRSKALQDAVSLFISERKHLLQAEGPQAGIIMLLYNHETRGLENLLTHVQHHFADIISATMHIHLNEQDCLEAIATKGDASRIRKLSNELSSKKGVKLMKVATVSL